MTIQQPRPTTREEAPDDDDPGYDPIADWIDNRALPGQREAEHSSAWGEGDDTEWQHIFAQEAEALAEFDDEPEQPDHVESMSEAAPKPQSKSSTAPADEAAPEDTRAARIRRLTYTRSQLDKIPPPTYLIDGVLNDNVLALLAGKFGTYKSFVSVAMACSVMTGVPWLGHEIKEPGAILYIAAEGVSGIKARIETWEQAHLPEGQRVAEDRLFVIGGSVNLSLGGDVDAVIATCAEIPKLKLVIWDTMHRCAPGVEENSNTEMGLIINRISQIREETGACQLVNHHTGHSGVRSRGASAIEDDFENSWVIKLGGDNEDRSPKNPRTMEHRKTKDGVLSSEIPIELATLGSSAYVQRAAKSGEDDQTWIIAAHLADLANQVGVPAGAGRRPLRDAVMAKHPDQKHADNVWAEAARIRKGGSQ